MKRIKAYDELKTERVLKKHKAETLQNASDQVLDFQEKLTGEMRKEPLLESTVVLDEGNDGQSVKDYYEPSGSVNERKITNPLFSDDEGQMTRYKEAKKKKLSFWNKGNILPDAQKFGFCLRVRMLVTSMLKRYLKMQEISKLTAIGKAILRYGASNIIDLSAHMKSWFCVDDKKFIVKNYESMLRIPELAVEEKSFVLKIENMVHEGKVDQAYKYCMEIHIKSEENSYLYKISKIYGDFIYKSKNQVDVLDFDSKSTHTEIDVILKACTYIVEGLSKNLKIYSRWSVDHKNGRKCDVRFLSISGVDLGEWEYSVKAVATKTIGDRCRSARINQSILNGLLQYNLNDEQVKGIQVPFLQFGGTSGQLLIEDLMEGFYIVFPGPRFELPTKLRDIGKLKTSINVIKSVMDMYKKTCETIENLETTRHEFDDIFSEDDIVDTTKPTHFKYTDICKPWWTPKSKKSK
ncbi:8698_t:CDS:2 [Ambispora gerdemannii]|uniref:8698_t:CDS:1 n=1 Tax=Ambispora gerdemannii TaxID=144530 RepID=A0A9N9CZT6_9GLOM|nr:8698_t:CDS:2 [Ambispora gerdemannii]